MWMNPKAILRMRSLSQLRLLSFLSFHLFWKPETTSKCKYFPPAQNTVTSRLKIYTLQKRKLTPTHHPEIPCQIHQKRKIIPCMPKTNIAIVCKSLLWCIVSGWIGLITMTNDYWGTLGKKFCEQFVKLLGRLTSSIFLRSTVSVSTEFIFLLKLA